MKGGSMLKRRLTALAAFIISAAVLSGCSARPQAKAAGVQTEKASDNIVYGNQVALRSSFESAEYTPDPFTSYTFEFSQYENKYMITVELSADGNAFNLTLEDNSFNFSTLEIKAPKNYTLNIPFSQNDASSVCSVIKNTVDDTPVPDILQFTFYLNNFEDESLPYSVKKFYSIKDNKLCEIKVIDASVSDAPSEVLEYCPDDILYHTEANVFMAAPQIDEDMNVSIYTYKFVPSELTLTKARQDSSYEGNLLYYGYAALAAADKAASYFTTTSLNVSDYENYVEIPSVIDSQASDYFFRVDDSRFTTTDDLKNFARRFFNEKLANELFNNAPQKYRDIDGALYTIVGDGGYDFTLGRRTITSFEKDGNTLTYHTKQEKFNEEDGRFLNFIDSGDFTIEVNPDDESFIFTQYRFSY